MYRPGTRRCSLRSRRGQTCRTGQIRSRARVSATGGSGRASGAPRPLFVVWLAPALTEGLPPGNMCYPLGVDGDLSHAAPLQNMCSSLGIHHERPVGSRRSVPTRSVVATQAGQRVPVIQRIRRAHARRASGRPPPKLQRRPLPPAAQWHRATCDVCANRCGREARPNCSRPTRAAGSSTQGVGAPGGSGRCSRLRAAPTASARRPAAHHAQRTRRAPPSTGVPADHRPAPIRSTAVVRPSPQLNRHDRRPVRRASTRLVLTAVGLLGFAQDVFDQPAIAAVLIHRRVRLDLRPIDRDHPTDTRPASRHKPRTSSNGPAISASWRRRNSAIVQWSGQRIPATTLNATSSQHARSIPREDRISRAYA